MPRDGSIGPAAGSPPSSSAPRGSCPGPLSFHRRPGWDYKDISPRVGIALDMFGNGKTAVKASLGRFLEGAGTWGNDANTNPTLRMPQTTPAFGPAGVTRAWSDANGNFIADCNLLDPSAKDLRASGGDLCGVMSDTRFGQDERTSRFDSAIVSGWGVRPSDWQLAIWLETRSRVRRCPSPIRAGGSRGFSSSTTARCSRRSSALSACPLLERIRGCPAVAATGVGSLRRGARKSRPGR